MDRQLTMENFLRTWNLEFPNLPLIMEHLKHPVVLIEALFHIFDALGIDRDAITKPPPEAERDEHMIYYWDLLPIINIIRIIKHVIPQGNDVPINVTNFLQPSAMATHHILMMLFNFTLFMKSRCMEIRPYEEELHSKKKQVLVLEDRKNKLLEMLNLQAEEKGKRKERIAKINEDSELYEMALKEEKEIHDKEKQQTDIIKKELHQLEVAVEQKKVQLDAILAEVKRTKALRVYDAEDIRAQFEQASRNVQEANDNLNSLKNTLNKKENESKNLQMIKPGLDTAINILDEVENSFECLLDYEQDNDSFDNDDECDVLLKEFQETLAEKNAAIDNAYKKRQECQSKRQNQKETQQSALRETEARDKKYREQCKKSAQRVAELRDATRDHDRVKGQELEELERMFNAFKKQLIECEETLMKMVKEGQRKIETRLHAHVIKDDNLQLDIDKLSLL